MGVRADILRLVIVDDDDLLQADAEATAHIGLSIQTVTSVAQVVQHDLAESSDVIVINLGLSGGFALVEKLAARQDGPLVIALASVGALGQSLEYTLTLAELRGAALALAKPIDAAELVVAAIDAVESRRDDATRFDVLRREFERRIAA